jgi:soluble lytic murein transglycosylase-like protein
MTVHFNLPEGLLSSVCYTESTHNITAIHHDDGNGDSLGLCQVKLKTAKFMGFKGTTRELMEPLTNTYYAAKYLSHQLSRYTNIKRGVIAYNMGSAKVLTTTKYQSKVFKYWRQNYTWLNPQESSTTRIKPICPFSATQH